MRALAILALPPLIALSACTTTRLAMPPEELSADCRERFMPALTGDPARDLLNYHYALEMCDANNAAERAWREEAQRSQ